MTRCIQGSSKDSCIELNAFIKRLYNSEINRAKYMPPSDWLTACIHHSPPMNVFLIPSTIVSNREPTNDLLSSHFLDINHRKHYAHTW